MSWKNDNIAADCT